jgi:hypothetical protein
MLILPDGLISDRGSAFKVNCIRRCLKRNDGTRTDVWGAVKASLHVPTTPPYTQAARTPCLTEPEQFNQLAGSSATRRQKTHGAACHPEPAESTPHPHSILLDHTSQHYVLLFHVTTFFIRTMHATCPVEPFTSTLPHPSQIFVNTSCSVGIQPPRDLLRFCKTF